MIFSACVLAFFLFRWFKGKYITEIDPITIVGIFFCVSNVFMAAEVINISSREFGD